MENKIGRNRQSPKNEEDFISAYIDKNPKAKKHDGMDIAAVILKDGTKGHGLLPANINRGHDKDYHIVKDFIPDSELKK
jgi:hypothetical protein